MGLSNKRLLDFWSPMNFDTDWNWGLKEPLMWPRPSDHPHTVDCGWVAQVEINLDDDLGQDVLEAVTCDRMWTITAVSYITFTVFVLHV